MRATGVLLSLLLLLASCRATPQAPDARLLRFFPSDYTDSRARFRIGCQRLAVSAQDFCRSWHVASQVDPDLTIDEAFFTSGGTRLLVLQSGNHGAESHSGAAVQAMVMERYLRPLLERGIDVYLIHALDPYGFKYNRRTDEFNVNLNRNFSLDGSIYRTSNPGYARYRRLFEPAGPVRSVALASLGGEAQFIASYFGNGFDAKSLNEGLNTGQYEFSEGVNYGGQSPAQQTEFLRQELAPLLARPYRKVLFLDFHTGLGEDGVLAIIRGINPSVPLLVEAKTLLGARERDGIEFRSGQDPGFFPTAGDVIDFVPLLAPDPGKVLAVTMEYGTMGTGTLPQLRRAMRIILENQAHFHGCSKPPVCAGVERNFRELFNPSDTAWRLQVMQEAAVHDNATRAAGEDRRQDCPSRPFDHVPDGRGHGVATCSRPFWAPSRRSGRCRPRNVEGGAYPAYSEASRRRVRRMPARGSECSPPGRYRVPGRLPAGFQALSPLLDAWIGVYRAPRDGRLALSSGESQPKLSSCKNSEPSMQRPSLLIASCLIATPAAAQPTNWLVGSWKLVQATQTENGQSRDYFGPQPLGQVIFEPNGQFSDILLRSDLPKLRAGNRAQGSPDENAAVVKGSIAYFGTYTLSGDKLKMQLEGSTFPNWQDTEQTRIVRESGNRFTWENAAGSAGGNVKLVFERVR